jgi:hypothetical protein
MHLSLLLFVLGGMFCRYPPAKGADTSVRPEGDTTILYIRGSCKGVITLMNADPEASGGHDWEKYRQIHPYVRKINHIHSDVLYDYQQHSSPDTSFQGSSFVQQQAVVNVYAPLFGKYPVVFHAGVLRTNVPYINNYIDVSVQFDRKTYGSSQLNNAQGLVLQQIAGEERKDSLLYLQSEDRFNQHQSLGAWLTSDKTLQQLIGSGNVVNQYPNGDSAATGALGQLRQISLQQPSISQALSAPHNPVDTSGAMPSTDSLQKAIAFIGTYADKLKEWRQSGTERDSLQHLYDSSRNVLQGRKDSADKLTNAGDISGLKKMGGDTTKQSWLMGIRQFSLGRSMVNYTELSAKNISLLGFNAEYYNHYYFALAAGRIDYRYLDFLLATPTPKQNLLLARFGIGEPEHKHLYFTVYTGTKQTSYVNTNGDPAVGKLTGITLEGRLPVDRNTYLTGEIAKSTYPQYIATGTAPGKMFGFSSRDNEAYSVQLFSYLPGTDTRIYGMYNKMGVYFQSFNLFNNNASTSSWQGRVDQYFWKKKVSVTASVKKDDYTTPFIVNNYKSRSVFYSLQASLRLRKWPVFSAGFMPSSQMTIVNNQWVDNRFYMLMGSSNYAYKVRGIFMNSSLVYTRYFNSSNQTGFLFYDAQSWFFNHSVLFKRFTLTGSATVTLGPGYYLLSVGPSAQWRISNTLSVGAGAKYNDLNNVQEIMGYNGNVTWQVGHLGRLSCSYERGYIPGQNNELFRNNWGRATYFKNF